MLPGPHLCLWKKISFFLKFEIHGKSLHFGQISSGQCRILNPAENKDIQRLGRVTPAPASPSVSGSHYLPHRTGFRALRESSGYVLTAVMLLFLLLSDFNLSENDYNIDEDMRHLQRAYTF